LREWNKKNYQQLKPSYLEGQFSWYRKQKQIFPPPNCNHPIYKAIGIYTEECEKIKNPLNYTIRRLRVRAMEVDEDKHEDNKKVNKKRQRKEEE